MDETEAHSDDRRLDWLFHRFHRPDCSSPKPVAAIELTGIQSYDNLTNEERLRGTIQCLNLLYVMSVAVYSIHVISVLISASRILGNIGQLLQLARKKPYKRFFPYTTIYHLETRRECSPV